MTKKTMVLVAVLAAVLVLGVGMASGMSRMDGGRMGGGHMMGGQAMMSGHSMQGEQGSGSAPAPITRARQVAVTAKDLSFSTTAIVVKPGEAVNVVFHNADEMVHDFSVPALGLHAAAQPGQTVTFGLQVTSPGTYEFLCTVPGHAGSGMRGTISAAS